MCRTKRAVVTNKPRHKNAIPYKREKTHDLISMFTSDEDYEQRRKASINN